MSEKETKELETIKTESLKMLDELAGFLPGDSIKLKEGTKNEFEIEIDEVPLPHIKQFLIGLAEVIKVLESKKLTIEKFGELPAEKLPEILIDIYDKVLPLLYLATDRKEEWFIEKKVGVLDTISLIMACIKANRWEEIQKKVRPLLAEVKAINSLY